MKTIKLVSEGAEFKHVSNLAGPDKLRVYTISQWRNCQAKTGASLVEWFKR